MENERFQYLNIHDEYADKIETFAKCVVKAAKAVHAASEISEKKCCEARRALNSGSIERMRTVIQCYIRQYGADWLHFRDVKIQCMDRAAYEQLSIDELQRQLRIIVALIYKSTAFKTGCKEVFKICVKKRAGAIGCFYKKGIRAIGLFGDGF